MSLYDLPRNDLQAALAVLKTAAAAGPVRPELLRSLAMLQDDPRAFLESAKSVDYKLVRPIWDDG